MDAFDIVILGFDRSRPDSPAAGLQRVFPIDQGTAVRLINALPATVKRGVPQVAAEQYQAALVAIGARVELRRALPKPEPKPAPAAVVTPGADAVTAVGTAPRFAGAATLKEGTPGDSVAPASVQSAAHRPTERPPVETSDRPLLTDTVPDAAPPVVMERAEPASASGEQWGGLLAAPKTKPSESAPPVASESAFPDERETNRLELFRRLLDPRQTGPAELAADEVRGGISALELDLPPPRAGWATAHAPASEGAAGASIAPLGVASAEDDHDTFKRPAVPHAEEVPFKGAATPRVQVYEPPPDARSFHEALPDAIALSVREGGARWVLLMGGVGLATAILLMLVRGQAILSTAFGLLAVVVLSALASEQAIWTLRAVVDDLDSPDGPDLRSEDIGRYFSAGFNLMCFGLATQLPFIAWLVRHRAVLPGALLSEPLGLLMFGVSAFYWPIAVGLSAISENPLAVWSFPRGLRVIFGALTEYTTLVLAAAIMALLPLGVILLLTRMGLPQELVWFGLSVGLALSQGAIAALVGHIARLHPKAFEDD